MTDGPVLLVKESTKVGSEAYYFAEKSILNITITPDTPVYDSMSTADASMTIDLDKERFIRSLEFLDPELSPLNSSLHQVTGEARESNGRVQVQSDFRSVLKKPSSSVLYLMDMAFVATFSKGQTAQQIYLGPDLVFHLDKFGKLLKVRVTNIRNGEEYRTRNVPG